MPYFIFHGFQEQETIEKFEQSKCLLEQEICRLKKGLEDTQSQLDTIKAEKKNLKHEVTESVAKIASLEDELADEKLKREHSSFDLQDQLDNERKLRQISEERLASLRARYEKDISNIRLVTDNKVKDEMEKGEGMKNETEHELVIEVSINVCV